VRLFSLLVAEKFKPGELEKRIGGYNFSTKWDGRCESLRNRESGISWSIVQRAKILSRWRKHLRQRKNLTHCIIAKCLACGVRIAPMSTAMRQRKSRGDRLYRVKRALPI
jgi:hypothetical protein